MSRSDEGDGVKRGRRPIGRALLAGAGATAALVAGWSFVGRPLLEARIERDLVGEIEAREGLAASCEEVEVCLPCGAYRVLDLTVRSADGSEPLLSIASLRVGLSPAALLGGDWIARLQLDAPLLHLDVGREQEGKDTALDLPWAEIGSALFPAPIDDVEIADGVVSIRHHDLETPVEWRFDRVSVSATTLSSASGDPPRISAVGRAFERGRFEGTLAFPDGADRFVLDARVSEVPLVGLRDYLASVADLEPEGGTLAASISLRGDPQGWKGNLHCRIEDLDLIGGVEEALQGPGSALLDLFVAGAAQGAELGNDGRLELEVPVEARLGETQVDAWGTLATLLRRALLAPFEHPLAALKTLKPG